MIFNITQDELSGGVFQVDDETLTPMVFGYDSGGAYMSDDADDETDVFLGRDVTGLYATDGAEELV